jgi:hypothetical protein
MNQGLSWERNRWSAKNIRIVLWNRKVNYHVYKCALKMFHLNSYWPYNYRHENNNWFQINMKLISSLQFLELFLTRKRVSVPGRGKMFSPSEPRSTLGPSELPKWVILALSQEVKRPGREWDYLHRLPTSRMRGATSPSPILLHGLVC